MLRLATSVHNDNSLIYRIIDTNNIYAFTYITNFIKDSDINWFDILVYTLQIESSLNNDKIVLIILTEMTKQNIIENYIDHVFEIVIDSGKVNIIKFVLDNNLISLDATFQNGQSLFEIVIDLKCESLVNLMLTRYNSDINSKDINGTSLVIKAVENDTPQISSIFILGKCDLECQNLEGKTLLQLCIERKWYLHVNYILGNGYTRLYKDLDYFHKMCHLAIDSQSTLIFDKLVRNHFASVIQICWRRYRANNEKYKTETIKN